MAKYGEITINVDQSRLREGIQELRGAVYVPIDLSSGVSVYDGGTNHRVPSGPRRAASKAYRAARTPQLVKGGAR